MATNPSIKPFPFERVFSEPTVKFAANDGALAGRIEALEAECERIKAEHEAAMAVARAEAFQDGLEQARGERAAALLAAVDALQASMEALGEGLTEIEGQLGREAGELAIAAADLLAARALELDPGAAIEDAIGRALNQVRRGHPIRIRVHPDLVTEVERLCAERQASERRRLSLTVIGDADLTLGDACLQWDQGGLRLDAETRRAAVRAEVDGIFAAE